MAAASPPNPFALAIDSFIVDIQRTEDVRTPFYKEVIVRASSANTGSGQNVHCAEQLAALITEMEQKQRRGSKT